MNGWRLFLKYVFHGNRRRIILVWIVGVAFAAVSLITPSQIGRLTNLFANNAHVGWPQVSRAIFLVMAAQIALSILNYLRKRMELVLQESITRGLTLDAYKRIMRFSTDFFRDREVEKINSRALEDTAAVAKFLVEASLYAPLAALNIVALGGMMLLNNWFLGLCMVPLSLLTGYFILLDRRIQTVNRRSRVAWDVIRTEAHEAVAAVSEFRNHCAFDHGLKGLEENFGEYHEAMTSLAKLQAIFQAGNPLIASLQLGTLYWIGASLCIGGSALSAVAGHMTWGDVIKFTLLAQLFQKPVETLGTSILNWRMSRESLGRVCEYLQRPQPFLRKPDAPALVSLPDLAFDQVSVTAASGAPVLNRVDMKIGPGQHTALCGPAGCGKSTTVQLIVRNLDPSSGEISASGRSIDEYDILAVAREIGFVPQKAVILNTSIRNNILLSLRRPSNRFIEDAQGMLDVTPLNSVATLADLDRELLGVIRGVGLEQDIFRKCLDSELPPQSAYRGIRGKAPALRAAIAREVAQLASDSVIIFDANGCIPGSIGQNLIGPGFDDTDAGPRARDLLTAFKSEKILDDLLTLAYRRFRSENALAVRVMGRAPLLAQFLAASQDIDVADAALLVDTDVAGLKELPSNLLFTLLEIALQTSIDTAFLPCPRAEFEQRIVAARKMLDARRGAAADAWNLANAGWDQTLSVRENLLGGRVNPRMRGASERVDGLLYRTLERENLLSMAVLLGLEFAAGEGGKFLSGGQKQKIAIARAVLKNPSILLLDEATASLDELSQGRIVDLVRDDFNGKTVVAISHRLSTVRDYDRIVVLDRGQVVQEGSYDSLAASEGLFRELVSREKGTRDGQVPARPAARDGDADELHRQLSLIPLFSRLESDHLEFLSRVAKVVQCGPGEILFHRGDVANELYVILSGQVEFFAGLTPEGLPQEIVTTYDAGRAFGEVGLFAHGRRTLGAKTVSDARLCVFGRDDLFELMTADPQLSIALLQGISLRMAEVTERAYRNDEGSGNEQVQSATKNKT